MAHVPQTMRAARMHEVGGRMSVDTIAVPEIGPTDVLVRVRACGMVPNLVNVLTIWPKILPQLPLPRLPAVFGLDPAGEVAAVGERVLNINPGERVYVNPARSCDACEMCRRDLRSLCRYFTFNGYFGFGPGSQKIWDMYPHGGFCEFMLAPQYAVVKLPESLSFEQAARFGYLGSAYAAIKKAALQPGQSLLIDGISGTLGLGAALLALALGVTRILGTGRDIQWLDRVKALAPARIAVHVLDDRQPTGEWARSLTAGEGVDAVISTLGAGAPVSTMAEALRALRRGGKAVNVGGAAGVLPVDVHWLMDEQMQLIGSNWFGAAEGREMAEMARAGTLDLSVFEHRRYALDNVNEAIAALKNRASGFANYVLML